MILLCACILLSCVIANRFSNKFGIPALFLFMALGMMFGSDGFMEVLEPSGILQNLLQ